MKRWAILTVFLYLAVLVLLTPPVLLFAGLGKTSPAGWEFNLAMDDVLRTYQEWGYWVWLAVLLLGQALLLLVPIDLAGRRHTTRRRLAVPVITAAFLFANVVCGAGFSLACALFGDRAVDFLVESTGWSQAAQDPIAAQAMRQIGLGTGSMLDFFLGVAGIILAFWLLWCAIFYRFAGSDDPDTLSRRLMRWLLRGSILELLVAVPSHVIVRGRNDCCAPMGTFWGIATGLSIMILSFGPGVFFLFVERFRRLKPARSSP
jgi:hypothetical protein